MFQKRVTRHTSHAAANFKLTLDRIGSIRKDGYRQTQNRFSYKSKKDHTGILQQSLLHITSDPLKKASVRRIPTKLQSLAFGNPHWLVLRLAMAIWQPRCLRHRIPVSAEPNPLITLKIAE